MYTRPLGCRCRWLNLSARPFGGEEAGVARGQAKHGAPLSLAPHHTLPTQGSRRGGGGVLLEGPACGAPERDSKIHTACLFQRPTPRSRRHTAYSHAHTPTPTATRTFQPACTVDCPALVAVAGRGPAICLVQAWQTQHSPRCSPFSPSCPMPCWSAPPPSCACGWARAASSSCGVYTRCVTQKGRGGRGGGRPCLGGGGIHASCWLGHSMSRMRDDE